MAVEMSAVPVVPDTSVTIQASVYPMAECPREVELRGVREVAPETP